MNFTNESQPINADFVQNPTRVGGSLGASAVVSFLPILTLFVALGFRFKVIWAALGSVTCAIIVAIAAFDMPVDMVALATLHGALFSLLPISWIVLNALFLYDLTVRSHAFDVVKAVLLSLSPDRRMQCLVIAYLFGGFLEGAAGFSTPVALAAAMLAGMGFGKVESASLALLANTIPVSFGALGTPISVIPEATGFEMEDVARATGRLQLPFSVFVPWMVVYASCGSVQGTLETWPALLTVSVAYTATLAITTEFVGARPVSVASSLVALVAVAGLLQVWQPTRIMRASDGVPRGQLQVGEVERSGSSRDRKKNEDGANGETGVEMVAVAVSTSAAAGPGGSPSLAPRVAPAGHAATSAGGSADADAADARSDCTAEPPGYTGGPSLDDDRLRIEGGGAPDDGADSYGPGPQGSPSSPRHDIFVALHSSISRRVTLRRQRQSFRAQLDTSAVIGALAAGPSPIDGVVDDFVDEPEDEGEDEPEDEEAAATPVHFRSGGIYPTVAVGEQVQPDAWSQSSGCHGDQQDAATPATPATPQQSPVVGGANSVPGGPPGHVAPRVHHSPRLSAGPRTPQTLRLRSKTVAQLLPSSPFIRNRWMAALGRIPPLASRSGRLGLGPAAQDPERGTPARSVSGSTVHSSARPASRAGRLTPSEGPGRSASASLAEGAGAKRVGLAVQGIAVPRGARMGNRNSSGSPGPDAEGKVIEINREDASPVGAGASGEVSSNSWSENGERKGSLGGYTKEEGSALPSHDQQHGQMASLRLDRLSTCDLARAFAPWVLLSVLVLVWGLDPVQELFSFADYAWNIPGLDNEVEGYGGGLRGASWNLNVLAATGTSILIAAVATSGFVGFGPWEALKTLGQTIRRMSLSLITIALLLALAYIVRAAGMDTSMGLALAETGAAFPLVSPVIGYLGVCLTGSATSSNVLFAGLQRIAAEQAGVSPMLAVAANAGGGVMGGMISLQSIVVAMVATEDDEDVQDEDQNEDQDEGGAQRENAATGRSRRQGEESNGNQEGQARSKGDSGDSAAGGREDVSLTAILQVVLPYSGVLILAFGAWCCFIEYVIPGYVG